MSFVSKNVHVEYRNYAYLERTDFDRVQGLRVVHEGHPNRVVNVLDKADFADLVEFVGQVLHKVVIDDVLNVERRIVLEL